MDIHEEALYIAFEILRAMDEAQEREMWWNTRHVGMIEANVHVALQNGVIFTAELIYALATGEEEHHEIVAMKEIVPLHYDYLNKALDNVYENQPGTSADTPAANQEQTEAGVPTAVG